VLLLSVLRLGSLGAGGAANYGWYTTASGHRLEGLVLDQVQYLQFADHVSGRGPAPVVEPFTSRWLAPWLAGQLGGDAATMLWLVNACCLVLGTFALARLAMDLTRSARWTAVAVAIWAISFPVFWYTSKALVDAAAVGLAACVVLALYRRWLVAGLVLLALAVSVKETAVVLVLVGVARELLVSDGPASVDGVPPRAHRWWRAATWPLTALVAYVLAAVVVAPELTFAPWLPSSLGSASRLLAMNVGSPGGLLQFGFTTAPAWIGVALWWWARRRGDAFLSDRDSVPLVVGALAAIGLSCWSLVSALWDGRTAWLSLPFGALLCAAWCADRRPVLRFGSLVRPLLLAGAAGFVVLVLWTIGGSLFTARVQRGTADALGDLQPRFATSELAGRVQGTSEWSGVGEATVELRTTGPVLLRLEADRPGRLEAPGLSASPAVRQGTYLLDAEGDQEVVVRTDGDWTLSARTIDRSLFWEALSGVSGTGPHVLVLPGGLVNSIELTVEAEDDLRLEAVGGCRVGECDDLEVREGSVTLPAGTEALVVGTAGEWSLVPERQSPAADAEVLAGTNAG
jgi:hypothetical protein